MEDSSEGNSEENMVSAERNVKRTLKTPAQVAALEKFYNEHKYPSEELKLEVAQQIGLTEKQISSWFCHRRLKDKKKDEVPTGGRQERSSSIIHDRGNGLRQDSCGSTKQADFKMSDVREVESERLYKGDAPTVDLSYGHGRKYTGTITSMGDLSPQSSSSLQDKSISPLKDPYNMKCSRYIKRNGNFLPPIPKSSNGTLYKPSGYLKVRGEIENAAITAVKRQLGRNYRDDGPLLGVNFDPLPPGAFASQSRDLAAGPIYVADPIRARSPEISGVRKQSRLSMRHEAYHSKMKPEDSYLEEENSNTKYGTGFHDIKAYYQPEQTSPYDGYASYRQNRKSSMDEHEVLAAGSSFNHAKRKQLASSNHDLKGVVPDIVMRRGLDGRKVKSVHRDPRPKDYDNVSPPTLGRNQYVSNPSNLIVGPAKADRSGEKIPFPKIAKDLKEYGQINIAKKHRAAAKEAKQSRVDFTRQELGKKDTFRSISQNTHAIEGSIMEKPPSFSEDENAETSSSSE